MGRRIWIVHKNDEITQQIRDEATANNCPEIARGVPPLLKKELWGQKLPLAYEEPEPIKPEPQRDFPSEIDDLKARIVKLEKAKAL